MHETPAIPTPGQSLGERPRAWAIWFIAAVFLGWLAIIWLWPVSIYTLTVDDSYYYLKTAANAAAGHGFKFDQINPTNGFHPLWMMVLVPLSWLSGGNMEVFARLAMTLQLAMVYLGAVLLSRTVGDRQRWIVLATAVLLLNFYFAKIVINALESGIQWLCVCATLAMVVRLLKCASNETSRRQWFGLGLLVGLTILSRLSAVFFAGGIGLMVIVLTWQAAGRAAISTIFLRLALLAVGIALPVTAYLCWSQAYTGHLTSVSAAIKISRPFEDSILGWVVGMALAAVWLYSCVLVWKSWPWNRLVRSLVWIAYPLLTYAVWQAEADIFLRGALISEIWYLVPQAVLLALAVGAMYLQGAARGGPWRRVSIATTLGLVVLAAVAWCYRLDPRSYAGYLAARRTADWLRQNTAPDAVVAGWDCGVIGGYADRRVANLDGLINSWDYKQNYLDNDLTEKWITDQCPVDYLAQEFWETQLNPETLRDYRGVNLLKWKVVHQESAMVRSELNSGKPAELFNLVLSRTGAGIPMDEFIANLHP